MTADNIALKHQKLSQYEPNSQSDGVIECQANTNPNKHIESKNTSVPIAVPKQSSH